MSIAQPLSPTGQRRIKADKEMAKGTEPRVMPAVDAHANESFFGRAGRLKSVAPVGRQGSSANPASPVQHVRSVQRARKRK